MPLVARRHVERGVERLVEQADRVVPLEARAQVVENLPRFLERRLGDDHRAEAPRERLVLLDVFLVFAECRGRDHPDLAARQRRLEHVGGVRRRAERRTGADHRVRLVDEQDQVRPFLQLANDVLNAVLEHAAQHRARDHRIHLEVDHLAVAQADRHGLRLELDPPREPFDDGRLADARLADQHHRIGALAVAENFEHLLDFLVAAVHGRQLVLARQQVEIGREVLEKWRQLEAFLQTLLALLHVPHAGAQPGHEHVRFNAMAPQNRDRHALHLFEHARRRHRPIRSSGVRRGSRDGARA